MLEIDLDISSNGTQRVFDVWRAGQALQYVISVCPEAERTRENARLFRRPLFAWNGRFADPTGFRASDAARLEQMRLVRDAIKAKIEEWCNEVCLQRPTRMALV
jgi:arsenate reductase